MLGKGYCYGRSFHSAWGVKKHSFAVLAGSQNALDGEQSIEPICHYQGSAASATFYPSMLFLNG